MQLARPAFAPHPMCFGRGRVRDASASASNEWGISEELRLFGTTFLVGFVFVSVLIA